jgi:branched-chain amino acid transport system substrate-binding protein
MSHQKKETLVLSLTLLITLGLLGIGAWWFFGRSGLKLNEAKNSTEKVGDRALKDRISFGEKSLIPGETSPAKRAGVEAIAAQNYPEAITNLEAALKTKRNDPEALIFLNNARIGNRQSYTIAVSVPIRIDLNGSLEILRGVAQAQTEINPTGIQGIPLKVAIANDDNNPEIAKQIASEFVNNSDILGVVGSFSSDVTLAAGTVYNSGKLVTISPISTSVKLSGFSPYVLRTVPSDYVAARALADYLLTQMQQKQAAVFFNSQSGYSQSLKSEFVTAISLGGGQVVSEFDLSAPGFSAAKSVEQAITQGAKVLMLVSNTGTLDTALQVVQTNRQRLGLLGGDDVYSPKTLEVGQDNAEGMVVAVAWHIDANLNSAFVRQSKQLWIGNVNWRTAMAYDATKALIGAIERDPTRTGVQQALISPNFSASGASGTVQFLPSGDRNAPIQLVKIVPGQQSGTGYDFVPISK